MLDLSNCVVCGVTANLNTELKISVPDETGTVKFVTVMVCDEHSEDITVKAARELYLKKLEDLENLIKQAKAMGFEINIPSNTKQLSVATGPPARVVEPPARTVAQAQAAPVATELQGPGVIDTAKLDKLDNRRFSEFNGTQGAVSGHGYSQSLPGHAQYNIAATSKSPEEAQAAATVAAARLNGKARVAIVEGRGGQPIPVPVMRQDGLGTTRVTVSQDVNDEKLQKHFKSMSHDSVADRGPDFLHSYNVRDCPICRGDGEVNERSGRIVCPKCRGSGMLGN